MSTILDKVFKRLDTRRENILNGNINCVPTPFTNFSLDYPGIEQEKYIVLTGMYLFIFTIYLERKYNKYKHAVS